MTRNVASEFAPRKVRVNQVTPGVTRTPIWSLIVPTVEAEKELEQPVSRSIPLGRFSEADEVAKAVLYLALDDSASVSETEIVVDGGATRAPLRAPVYRTHERLLANSNACEVARQKTLRLVRASSACCPDRLRSTRHDVRWTSGDDAPRATHVIRFVIRVRRT
jgi:hypothetical protein